MNAQSPFESAEVNQAAGMVSLQADCYIEEALQLMEDRASVAHITVEEIAAAVLDRSIQFGPDSTV